MAFEQSLVAATASHDLEEALRARVQRRAGQPDGLGELAPLAIRLGLIQGRLAPCLDQPQLLVFAADHGLAVDGIAPNEDGTAQSVQALLEGRAPLARMAAGLGVEMTVVDAGVAHPLPPHARLLPRKIAHGTRNSRLTQAMSVDQAHAAIRAGMEIGDHLPGHALIASAIGEGSGLAAALVIAKLTGLDAAQLARRVPHGRELDPAATRAVAVLRAAEVRHLGLSDPIELLACCGGFEIAMLTGALVTAAGRRQVILVDGLAACAALLVASRIAPAVTDYCVFCVSNAHPGLRLALDVFAAGPLMEMELDTLDGTGAVVAWPLLRCAAAVLADPAPAPPDA